MTTRSVKHESDMRRKVCGYDAGSVSGRDGKGMRKALGGGAGTDREGRA